MTAPLPISVRPPVVDWIFQNPALFKSEDRTYGCIKDIAKVELERIKAFEERKYYAAYAALISTVILITVSYPLCAAISFIFFCIIFTQLSEDSEKQLLDIMDKDNNTLILALQGCGMAAVQESPQPPIELCWARELFSRRGAPHLFRAAWRNGTVPEAVIFAAIETYLKYKSGFEAGQQQAISSAHEELEGKLRLLSSQDRLLIIR